MKYKVTLVETWEVAYLVEADSAEEAEDKVQRGEDVEELERFGDHDTQEVFSTELLGDK